MSAQHDPMPDAVAGSEAMRARVMHELAAATATLTVDHDVIGVTTSLLLGYVRAVEAAAGGLMLARPDDQQLELLTSTSHRAHELEMFQLQIDQGPCIDAVRTRESVTATGIEEIAERWPALAGALRAAAITGVHASPMLWRDEPLGAINLFFTHFADPQETAAGGQAFADIATIAIVHSGHLSGQDIVARARAALDERIVIERAKGVLAYSANLSLDLAFEQLLRRAYDQRRPLGRVAAQIINNASNGHSR